MVSPITDIFGFPILDNTFGLPTEVVLGIIGFLGITGMWPIKAKGPITDFVPPITLALAALIAAKRYDLIPAGTYYTQQGY